MSKTAALVEPRWLQIVRGAYLEMPGLSLTRRQAQRLWSLDPEACQGLFDALVETGFLRERESGVYVRAELIVNRASHAFASEPPGGTPRDWSLLIGPGRPSALLVAPDGAPEAFARALEPLLRRPVFHWPADGCPWTGGRPFSTLVLHDVNALSAADQASLMRWMDSAAANVQVISLASADMFALVRSGAFLEALFYRLNVVYIDAETAARSLEPSD